MEIMPYIWFGIALFMAILEAVTYQLVSIWFVFGALISAIVAIFIPENLTVQIIVFVAVSLITLIATRPIVKKLTKVKKSPTNSDRYIGKTGFVKIDINNELGTGQVTINGSVWSAKSQNNKPIKKGTKITVQDIKGVKLIVTPIEE
jgi:membrane protein implicated in regulation of membrane protease activity